MHNHKEQKLNPSYAEAALAVFFCWKHSRQKTGRPCVGLKGTVVSLPQLEQTVRVSTFGGAAVWVTPSACPRFALQPLQRLGSFLNCLSWKNSCSPAVKTKSSPQSIHLMTLSWNSMDLAPFSPTRTVKFMMQFQVLATPGPALTTMETNTY